ncbi:MAG TPA: radical SAM protein [Planctomycetaceae bacterium]|nr:radical SAM protein [Planctomycetaceae bacterium]
MSKSAELSERALEARRHLGECRLCEHRCGANRLAGGRGPCHAGASARVFRHRVEYGEELQLVPSHLFYVSGCDLRCMFCIAEENAFDPGRGETLNTADFAAAVAWGRTQGARNVQWVGGEPTIHLPAILEAMAGCPELPPIVWKSDFHGTPEAFALLDGIVDVYVADFKFGNDACANRIAGVENYLAVVARNLRIAGAAADLIVRHLLLPGHFDCCYRPIVRWMQQNLPFTKFSVRDGYMPRWRAKDDEKLARMLDRDAGRNARALAAESGLKLVI